MKSLNCVTIVKDKYGVVAAAIAGPADFCHKCIVDSLDPERCSKAAYDLVIEGTVFLTECQETDGHVVVTHADCKISVMDYLVMVPAELFEELFGAVSREVYPELYLDPDDEQELASFRPDVDIVDEEEPDDET